MRSVSNENVKTHLGRYSFWYYLVMRGDGAKLICNETIRSQMASTSCSQTFGTLQCDKLED